MPLYAVCTLSHEADSEMPGAVMPGGQPGSSWDITPDPGQTLTSQSGFIHYGGLTLC